MAAPHPDCAAEHLDPHAIASRRGNADFHISSRIASSLRKARVKTDDGLTQKDIEQLAETTPLLQREQHDKRLADMGLSRDDDAKTIMSWLFLRDRNALFAADVELALRVAFFATVLGAAMIMPGLPVLGRLVDSRLLTAATLQYIFFTISESVGRTIQQACNSLVGVLLAVSSIWALDAIFPGGVGPNTGPETSLVGAAYGVVFIVGVPWLNMPMATIVFAGSRFIIWWMNFLNPNESLDILSEGSTEVSAACLGGLASILCTLLPYPLSARRKSLGCAMELAQELRTGWEDFVSYFCSNEENAYRVRRIDADLREIFDTAADFEKNIEHSWWECSMFPQKQRSRLLLSRLHELVVNAYGRLLDVKYICVKEDFDGMGMHQQLMDVMRVKIQAATDKACTLLELCSAAACDGCIDGNEAREMQSCIEDIIRIEIDITVSYHATKKEVIERCGRESDEQAADVIVKPLMDEDAFCYEICAFCRLVRGAAVDFLSYSAGKPLPSSSVAKTSTDGSFMHMLDRDVICSVEQATFALKTSLAVLAGFLVGYVSNGTLLPRHDATAAYLCALLTTKSQGSAMSRTLARLQGMVIGFVTGSGLHAVVFTVLQLCGWEGRLIMITCFFAWVAMSMFIYFHSDTSNNAYVGQLLAIVGTPPMVARCFQGEVYHYARNQFQTNSLVLMLLLLGAVNNFFSSRVSSQAHEKLVEVWHDLGSSLASLFQPNVGSMKLGEGALRISIATAEALGKEALEEPRFWRPPWKDVLFASCCQKADRMRLAMRSIEAVAISKSGKGGLVEGGPYAGLLQMTTFQELSRVLLKKHAVIEKLLAIFNHDTSKPMMLLQKEEVLDNHVAEWSSAMKNFLNEVNGRHTHLSRKCTGGFDQEDAAADSLVHTSLENDKVCEVNRVILNMGALMYESSDLQSQLLASQCDDKSQRV